MNYFKVALSFVIGLVSTHSFASEYYFDPAMIDGVSGSDVSLLNRGLPLPGWYYVSVYVNGKLVSHQSLLFKYGSSKNDSQLVPCLSLNDLKEYGIDTSELTHGKNNKINNVTHKKSVSCVRISSLRDVSISSDIKHQQVNIFVPRNYLLNDAVSGMAPEGIWDDGLSAFVLGYDVNTQWVKVRGQRDASHTSKFIQLQPGINIGSWRIRNNLSWVNTKNNGGWQTLYSYAERGVNSIKSRFVVGDSYSSGTVFDSIPFRGIKLYTDDSMIPFSKRAFAPVIRGIARTQARVEVKQFGYTLTSVVVPAGQFELTNIPASGANGDLHVIVNENDGTKQEFNVPFTTPAIALHRNFLKYSFAIGKYRSKIISDSSNPFLSEVNIAYGFPLNFTGYTGAQLSKHYQVAALGIGTMLSSAGAVSVDVSKSHAYRDNKESSVNGLRWQVRYNNYLPTGTTFSLSYKTYSEGYNSFSDVVFKKNIMVGSSQPKSQTGLNVSQPLLGYGYLNLFGTRELYRGFNRGVTSYGVDYNITLPYNISLGLSWNRSLSLNRTPYQGESITSLWLSIPFVNHYVDNNPVYITYQNMTPSNGYSSNVVGVNGTLLDRQLNWEVQDKIIADRQSSKSAMVNLSYQGTYGQIDGNYGRSNTLVQYGLGAHGDIVATKETGFVFGQKQGETIAIVKADGVSGAKVGYWPGEKTDLHGYTLDGGLQPYSTNRININPLSLPPNAALSKNSVNVTPTKGAVVLADFHARIGARLLLTLRRNNGSILPFGSIVNVDNGVNGIVDDNGSVYLTGIKNGDVIKARWSNKNNDYCTSTINLDMVMHSKTGIDYLTASCNG
ncbi:F1 capsule-anchoring protein precursor [Edwardsiella tarda]|uniref:Fimbria/pilus outer membrane usher protein n=1 Tax=Edwardsiella tarda ATCC 15947 = NBRC 105688 TaxID=667121 RepID=A0AC61TMX5_EDWTA|nr:fimbria/pilus outer membrane usher protein [Edwardsiella tarda]UAL58203.1 fimbria/pilus outer membrane usher protein [Edwardsiella tarda]UCQ02044.1 fimbria/pilus outer membrane usher protein [Edwardsiella tarda ATCC 15947 = NBRC 105688]STE53084.1 F1 capsule-anchoring protein precursor [Edwardsiella tarda]